jgi:hypothetical protein
MAVYSDLDPHLRIAEGSNPQTERRFRHVLALQREIARAVVHEIQIELSARGQAQL